MVTPAVHVPDTPIAHEYRVVWCRAEGKPRRRIFQTLRGAQRFATFLGPEPWKAIGKEPDDPFCCAGRSCTCQGQTWRQYLLGRRGDREDGRVPRLVSCFIERRTVGAWESGA